MPIVNVASHPRCWKGASQRVDKRPNTKAQLPGRWRARRPRSTDLRPGQLQRLVLRGLGSAPRPAAGGPALALRAACPQPRHRPPHGATGPPPLRPAPPARRPPRGGPLGVLGDASGRSRTARGPTPRPTPRRAGGRPWGRPASQGQRAVNRHALSLGRHPAAQNAKAQQHAGLACRCAARNRVGRRVCCSTLVRLVTHPDRRTPPAIRLSDCPIRGCFHKSKGCETIRIPAT